MSTSTQDKSSGTSIWTIIAIVVGVLVLASLAGAIIKSVLWIAFVVLAVVGAFTVIKAFGGK
ncbi:hypothetical protein [Gordonia sp. VNK21]|uniref:hypothetical protein n=1 Tax=Gordonia sp. VNK21 TaxID=3382483 RepID=UPI0038D3927F